MSDILRNGSVIGVKSNFGAGLDLSQVDNLMPVLFCLT